MERLSFRAVEMHGMVVKRRVSHFGWLYGYQSWDVMPGPSVPDWIMPLRDRVATLIGVPAMQVEQTLISQYPPGAGIGWHRDAPMFGPILGSCRFRFQRKRDEVREVSECLLEPRSAYLLRGQAQTAWQHSIPPTKSLRYSLTCRTLKGEREDKS